MSGRVGFGRSGDRPRAARSRVPARARFRTASGPRVMAYPEEWAGSPAFGISEGEWPPVGRSG
ncbi:hypothetical protein GCM10018963_27110 [Saccharothrix longispora]